MFIKTPKNQKPGELPPAGRRGRGRPRGTTQQGIATRTLLYKAAIKMIAAKGYEATTLRDIAKKAKVSVGLLYRYFPSKRAIVLALYDELSQEFAVRASRMSSGKWHERFMFALRTSLLVLGPHRATIAALIPLMVSDEEEGLFSSTTASSQLRVQQAFVVAVCEATDSPGGENAAALGRLLYIVQLVVLLWWVLEKSPKQRVTAEIVEMLDRLGFSVSVALRVPGALALVRSADRLIREGLFEGEQPRP